MKPRTRLEHRAVAASRYLPELTAVQTAWARENLFDHVAYCRGGQAWCSDCGGVFAKEADKLVDQLDNDVVCPHCGHRLKARRSLKQKIKDRAYMTIATTCGALQVARTWECNRQCRQGSEVYYTYNEVTRIFIDADGSRAVMACNRAPFSYYQDRWTYGTMSIKRKDGNHYGDPYSFEGAYYPRSRVIAALRRNGYRHIDGAVTWEVMQLLLTSPRAETLIKSGQDELLAHMCNRRWPAEDEWHAVKIAIRHGYKVEDAPMWVDMLRFMRELGMDTHNPRYVCPDDLKAAHDRLQARLARKRKDEEYAEQSKKAAEAEDSYRNAKQPYFGLVMTDGAITIRPLQSVAEFVTEGEAMHHCVFDGGYYKHRDALILTARDKDDHRLETVEINLDTLKVVQSRGRFNGTTDQHDAIVRLVKRNIDKVRRIQAATATQH